MNEAVFDSFPVLQTERLVLRAPVMSDAEHVYRIFADAQVLQYAGKKPYESLAEAQERVQRCISDFGQKEGIRWAITDRSTGHYLGSGGLWRLIRQHQRAEIGYELYPQYWGQGYMTEAIAAICRFGFEQLQLHTIEGNIHPGNTGSARVLEKIGFVLEGYFRENYLFDGTFSDTASYTLFKDRLQVEDQTRGR